MGLSRQEYWSGLPCPSPGIFPTRGVNLCLLCLLHWQECSLPLALPGKPNISRYTYICTYILFLNSFQLEFIARYWLYFPVLYSKSLLFMCFIYGSIYLLIPYFHLMPSLPPNLSPLVAISWLSMSVRLPVFFNKFTCTIFLDYTVILISYNIWLCLISLSMIISEPIHVAANDDILFYFMAELYFSVYVHIFSIQSSVNGHLDCFHVLTIVN